MAKVEITIKKRFKFVHEFAPRTGPGGAEVQFHFVDEELDLVVLMFAATPDE